VKALHFKLRTAVGIVVPGLLGTALVVSAAALPASAQGWQDTALVAGALNSSTFGGGTLRAATTTVANGPSNIALSATGTVTWSLHGTVPTGVTLSGVTISYTGAAVSGTSSLVVDARDTVGNVEALVIPVTLAANSISITGTVTTVALSSLAATNTAGTVVFSAVSSIASDSISFAESNLPAGLTSGSPVLTYVGGTAAPGTYSGVVVTVTDSDGATLSGTFSLTVDANAVSQYGDEVNRFGNGFDSYQQHQYPGAIIAGWTATQNDPATHFILNNGTHQGAFQFEYAPNGSGSGLCVSDPGGGWASDPLRDGLILTSCNTGPWQQFIPQSNGTLQNVATGLFINPNGTGAQLRGGTTATPWGGSFYTWTNNSSLPA
jgi:hypothetical protein